MTRDDLERELLEECADDYVGLWRFPWDIRERLSVTGTEEVKCIALEMIRKFLVSKSIVAGDLRQGSFSVWRVTPEEAITRIEIAWGDLGREPGLLEIAWLTTPSDVQIPVVEKPDLVRGQGEP